MIYVFAVSSELDSLFPSNRNILQKSGNQRLSFLSTTECQQSWCEFAQHKLAPLSETAFEEDHHGSNAYRGAPGVYVDRLIVDGPNYAAMCGLQH